MAAGGRGGSPEPAPRVARDVMAFGQETGRALSDGRIVGRAEPFAKVFPSSRAVKRAVGAMAWAVLEDIALDARIDDAGRLVSETNVRRIAENLALNKDTVTRHLGRLREHGFVLQEEARDARSDSILGDKEEGVRATALDFKPAHVRWADDSAEPIEADVAISNGWLHLRTQIGHVWSYPPNRVASVGWKDHPSMGRSEQEAAGEVPIA